LEVSQNLEVVDVDTQQNFFFVNSCLRRDLFRVNKSTVIIPTAEKLSPFSGLGSHLGFSAVMVACALSKGSRAYKDLIFFLLHFLKALF